jgi:hypothetical protein
MQRDELPPKRILGKPGLRHEVFRKPREKHKDKEQDVYTFYSTEALITKIARQHSQAHFAPAKQ